MAVWIVALIGILANSNFNRSKSVTCLVMAIKGNWVAVANLREVREFLEGFKVGLPCCGVELTVAANLILGVENFEVQLVAFDCRNDSL
ncbi:hypothetical protein [Acidithrix ferrooxidans]|uniref:hypothetical protein n=1 Tax=Acidithrix ferrooxidans TaxID=1280514 RepID=UPI00126A2412|nr:hypothetical protein [Acidithrix ferrooxidans]